MSYGINIRIIDFGNILEISNTIINNFKSKIMSKGKLITGICIGAAVGAVLGILFAPEKGTDTRKKISQKGSDWSQSIMDKFNELGDAIADKFDNLKGEAKEGLDKAKDKASHARDEAKRNFA